ncbi:MAG TPA: S24 family peptidase [Chitinophagaceae bacterium]|nr:S24 family peptidase [Chitinophagaceae bacterium]
MSKNTGHEAVIEQLRLVYKGVLENSIYANDSEVYDHSTITYSDRSIRQPKTNTNHQTDGITFLPISAQAGYPKRYNDPIFTTQLQKLFIPGFPYRGERYRIWEVEGNSMEPTFKEHFHLLTELVEPDSWKNVRDFYAYVIVTLDDVLFKRIAKHTKNKDLFILISDNEELYPQFTIEIKAIKEIWIVKRKMDWEMSPPKRFDIKI